MSVNSAVFSPPNPAPLLVAGREILLCSASAVSLDLTTSREPGAWGNYAFDRGTVYVTALRAVFVPDDKAGGVESVVLPLDNVRNLKLEQPLFGANSISKFLSH